MDKKQNKIIGIYLEGKVCDSEGKWTSEHEYINKVTPTKKTFSFSESESASSSCAMPSSPVSTSSYSMPSIDCVSEKLMNSTKSNFSFGSITNKSSSTVAMATTSVQTKEPTNKKSMAQFASLSILARPTLKIGDKNIIDRTASDAKIENLFMQNETECVKWLIQQGLVRSTQECSVHPNVSLKLSMFIKIRSMKKSFDSELKSIFLFSKVWTRIHRNFHFLVVMNGQVTVVHPDMYRFFMDHCLRQIHMHHRSVSF